MNEIRCATSGFGSYLIIKPDRHYYLVLPAKEQAAIRCRVEIVLL